MRHAFPTRTRGFTLVEVLVTIGLIVLVVSVAMPMVSAVQRVGLRTREAAALRQVLTGWVSYATDSKGALLPGFRSGLPVYQADGAPIPSTVAGSISELEARFPWRLLPYLGHTFQSLYVNESAERLQELQSSDPAQFYYLTSLYPSFGLNSVWVGGDQQRYGFMPATLPNGAANPLHGFYVSRLSGIVHPGRLTVFTSSRTNATVDGGMREGYFRVESPRFLANQAATWAAVYDPLQPASCGGISTRSGSEVLAGTADGATAWESVDTMRDMRRWADRATSADWGIGAP